MELDYSTLSDEELEAIANDDYSKLSDNTLAAIAGEGAAPKEEPGMLGKAGELANEYLVKPAVGVVGTGLNMAASGYNAIPGHDVITGIAAYKAAPHLANKAGAAWEGTKQGAKIMYDMASGAAKGPVMPGTPANPAAVYAGQGAAPAPAPQPPSMMNKASDIVRKLALDKVLKNAGIAGAGMTMAQGLFGTSPDEIATMKAAEQKQIAAGGQPKKRIDWLANLGQ